MSNKELYFYVIFLSLIGIACFVFILVLPSLDANGNLAAVAPRNELNSTQYFNPKPAQPVTSEPQKTPEATSTPATVKPQDEVVLPPQDIPLDQGVITDTYTVTAIEVAATTSDPVTGIQKATSLVLRGKAEPNTVIVLYIYSTPIIVMVTTDNEGNWSYNLDQELEDGEHKVYVAKVDNSGSILARSEPIFFRKAEARVTFETSDSVPINSQSQSFFQKYFLIISISIVAAAILIALMIVGVKRENDTIPPLDTV
jgi:hypothetical protein